MRTRVSAVIIRDQKLLLVTGYSETKYWTPGGGVEAGETFEQALERELREELDIKILNPKPLCGYDTCMIGTSNPLRVECFLCDYQGELKPHQEITKYGWFDSRQCQSDLVVEHQEVPQVLIPKLLELGLL